MIPLTELAVGNATGRADLSRRNQMKADESGRHFGNIPKGFHRAAQGWPHGGLPWVDDNKHQNPNGVSSTGQGGGRCNPVGVDDFFGR